MPFSLNNAASMPAYRGAACIASTQYRTQVDGVAAGRARPEHVANIPTYRPNVTGRIAHFEALALKAAASSRPTRLESPGLVAAVMRTMAAAIVHPKWSNDEAFTPDSPTRTLVSKQGLQIAAFLGFNARATGEPSHLRGM